MDKITTFEELQEKADDIVERLSVVRTLLAEANDLFRAIDISACADSLGINDEDMHDNLYELAYEIRHAGNFIYEGYSPTRNAFWLPSTC